MKHAKYFRTHDLAEAVGQSDMTIRRFLKERDPDHVGWWLFSESEFSALLAELRRNNSRRRFGNRRKRKRIKRP